MLGKKYIVIVYQIISRISNSVANTEAPQQYFVFAGSKPLSLSIAAEGWAKLVIDLWQRCYSN